MSISLLLVSDSVSDRQKIIKTLDAYNVLLAADLQEAARKLEQRDDIYLMLLDLDLAGRDGIQFLKTLKNSSGHQFLRTIIMSKECDQQLKEIEGLRLGIIDCIKKPLDLEFLKAKVSTRAEIFKTQDFIKRQAQNQLRLFETIFHQAPIGIAISLEKDFAHDKINKNFNYNPEFKKICKRSKNELQSIGWEGLTHPDDLLAEKELFRKLQNDEIDRYSLDKRIKMPDGSYKWVHLISAKLNYAEKSGFHYVALLRDIDEEKNISTRLLESERSKSVLISNLHGMAYRCSYDRDWTMEFVSSGCHVLCGCDPEKLQGNKDFSFNELIAPEYREHLWKEWKTALDDKARFQSEYEIIDANGVRKWVLEIGEGVFDETGQVEALEGIIIDISDRKKIENQLRYVTEHDDWTDLYNLHYLEKMLRKDQESGEPKESALVCVNLNSMYSLGLKYGMYYAQKLIKKIADSLLKISNEQRMIFSSASYRFVYYIKDYKDKSDLLNFCTRVVNVLHTFLDVERIGFGIGVYEINDLKKNEIEETLKKLLLASEEALAASSDDSNIYFYDNKLEQRVYRNNIIQQELAAVAEGEKQERVSVQFQPIIDLCDNSISGFETLARFNTNELGLISPLEFIPIAEETKDIIPIGKLILEKACRFLKKLQSCGHDCINISINISAVQILSKDFVENTITILSELDLDPKNIHLELTESVFSENIDQINSVFRQLNGYGIKISIDDFGTAYSSLSRLRELQVDTIKIDRPFIAKINDLDKEITITSDIISMAHKMDLLVVAEGVETKYQYDYLKQFNCDKIQGFLISKPLDEQEAFTFAENLGNNY